MGQKFSTNIFVCYEVRVGMNMSYMCARRENTQSIKGWKEAWSWNAPMIALDEGREVISAPPNTSKWLVVTYEWNLRAFAYRSPRVPIAAPKRTYL